MLFDKPLSLTDALRFETLKKVLAVSDSIGSRDIQDFIPAHIRETAFFSARTPYADYLSATQAFIGRLLQPDVRVGPDSDRDHLVPTAPGGSISPAQVRAKMKQHLASLGYQPDPAKRGGLQDLSSDRRTNLIIDTQLSMARGQGSWRQSQDPDVLAVWPADELYRAINPKGQARDWQSRWNAARADLGESTSATYAEMTNGPFVALKNDPIWSAISRFETPYPPFDYGSGMRVRNVGRRRAIALGLMDDGDKVTPVKDPLNRPWSVALQDTRPDVADALQQAFGERASLQGDRLFILPDPLATLKELVFRASSGEQASGAFAFLTPAQQSQLNTVLGGPVKPGVTFDIDASHITHSLKNHGNVSELQRGQIPITDKDVVDLAKTVASGTPRKPTPAELRNAGPMDVTFDCHQGYTVGGSYSKKANRFLVHTIYRRAQK